MSQNTSPKTSKDNKSLASQMFAGAGVMVGGRMIIRLLGLVSVSFTARLLSPEDFGIVGAASLVIALFSLFNRIGFDEAILRMEGEHLGRLNTLWTIRFTVSSITAVVIMIFAPAMASLLQESRIETVLYFMSGMTILYALHSPAVDILRKRMEFKKEVALKVLDKCLTVILVLGFIYFERSYMGLVYGQISAVAIGIVTSQLFYSFRPSFTFKYFKQEISFSFWTFVRNISNYSTVSVDEWAAKRASGTAAFGAYHAAHDLSRLIVSEMLHPIGETFATGIQTVRDDFEQFKSIVIRFLAVIIILGVPLASGFSLLAPEAVYLLLGYQWGDAIAFIPYLSFAMLSVTLSDMMYGIYVALDIQRTSAIIKVSRAVAVTLVCFAALLSGEGALLVAQSFCAITAVFLIIEYVYILNKIKSSVFDLVRMFYRPVAASLIMTYILLTLSWPDTDILILTALMKAAVGAVVYGTSLISLWFIVGRPSSGESELLARVMPKLLK